MLNTPKKFYPPVPAETERIGKLVLDAAYKVHTVLGPGLLESVYQIAMKHVLETGGILAETEVKLPILFEGVSLESALRIDLSKVRLGFLINFNMSHLKDGIKRIVV